MQVEATVWELHSRAPQYVLQSFGPHGHISINSISSFRTERSVERTISMTGTRVRQVSSPPGPPTDGSRSTSLSLHTTITSIDLLLIQTTSLDGPTHLPMERPTLWAIKVSFRSKAAITESLQQLQRSSLLVCSPSPESIIVTKIKSLNGLIHK